MPYSLKNRNGYHDRQTGRLFYLWPHNHYTIYFNNNFDVSNGKLSKGVNMQVPTCFLIPETQNISTTKKRGRDAGAACDLMNRRSSIAAQNCQQFVCGKHRKKTTVYKCVVCPLYLTLAMIREQETLDRFFVNSVA